MGQTDMDSVLIILLGIIIIAICVYIIMKTFNGSKEGYGSLMRKKLLSKYAGEGDTLTEANKINTKENYSVPRGSLITPNMFNWLKSGQSIQTDTGVAAPVAPVVDISNPNTTVAQDIGNSAVNQINEITTETAQRQPSSAQPVPNLTQPTPSSPSAVDLTQNTYNTNPTGAEEPVPVDDRDVISNSGNSLETPASESFQLSRINNTYSSILPGNTIQSQIAQAADQVQTSVEMKQFEKEQYRRMF